MKKVAGGLAMAELAFWLGWIALLQGITYRSNQPDCSLYRIPIPSQVNCSCLTSPLTTIPRICSGCMVKALPYDYSASIEASLSFGFPTHLSLLRGWYSS
jgi:hypothetical protein